MRKLGIAAGILVVLLATGDVAAKSFAEGRVATTVEERAAGAQDASAQIRSFPFLGRLLVSGSVPSLDLHVDQVTTRGLTFSDVSLDLEGLTLDQGVLMRSRKVEVVDLDRGVVTLHLGAAPLGAFVGQQVQVSGGRITVTVAGRSVEASVTAAVGALEFTVAPLPSVRVPLPGDLVPCQPDVRVQDNRIRLSCAFEDVPPALVRAASSAT